MSDVINLSVTTQPQTTRVTVTTPSRITVNLLSVATVDPRVMQAKADAESAAQAAELAAAGIASDGIIYALIFG